MEKPWYKRWWAILFFIIVGLNLVNILITQNTPRTSVPPPKVEQKGVEPRVVSEAAKPANWEYYESQDEMGRGTIKMARTRSTNTLSFDFPYAGPQHGTLTVRSHPRYGKDIMLSIEKGQFLTGIDGCKVLVRFDNDKPQSFWANGPSDHSTTTIFISGFSKFVAALRKSERVMIEAPFYHQGNQILQFSVGGLKWEVDVRKKK